MNCLLLAVLTIVVYAEVLPTTSLMFEYIRTWIAYGITSIQQRTTIMQEEIQQAQERLQPQQAHAIGFQVYDEGEEDYEED